MSADPAVPDLAVSQEGQYDHGHRLYHSSYSVPGLVLLQAEERESTCDEELGAAVKGLLKTIDQTLPSTSQAADIRPPPQYNYCFLLIGTICKVYPKGVKIFKRLSI